MKNTYLLITLRKFSTIIKEKSKESANLIINNKKYDKDNYTNITPKILTFIGENLHNRQYHPLCFLKERIIRHIYGKFVNNRKNPLFSVYENISPIVTVEQNFDSLLIPLEHPSRSKTDCYYINRNYVLRAHTTAHQAELIRSGLDNFLIIGDVYRRDEIDSTHYPVFHQADAVRLIDKHELSNICNNKIEIFENSQCDEKPDRQSVHTKEATVIMEKQLKTTLESLAGNLFGKDIKTRWVNVYFPFTHPSWELEIYHNDNWLEILGCGIMRHDILKNAGVDEKIGWAFGLGLERLAMHLYKIPDIRLFWSKDSGFTSQFDNKTYKDNITYKPVSIYPQCKKDISFWLPENTEFHINDFFELVRDSGGDIIEQITLQDEFRHPKTKKLSLCFRITYRHLERTLTNNEVNELHNKISKMAENSLNVILR